MISRLDPIGEDHYSRAELFLTPNPAPAPAPSS